MKTTSVALGCTAALLVAAACNQTYPLASRYIKSVPVKAQEGALITVESQDSAELAGASLYLPPNALNGDTTVTVELGLENLSAAPDVAASKVVMWGPAGTTLRAPAEVVLPYALPAGERAAGLRVDKLLGNGQRIALDRVAFTVDGARHEVRFRTEQLAAFEVVVTHCGEDHPCPEGTHCVEGTCVAPNCGTQTCHSGQLCCDGVCKTVDEGQHACPVPACGIERPCPDGQLCEAGSCHLRCGSNYPDVTCPEGTHCLEGGICWPHAPSVCGADRPCDQGYVCDEGACRLRCGPDFPEHHCPEPQHCIENYVCR